MDSGVKCASGGDLMATVIQKRSIASWAARHDVVTRRRV